LEAANLGLHN